MISTWSIRLNRAHLLTRRYGGHYSRTDPAKQWALLGPISGHFGYFSVNPLPAPARWHLAWSVIARRKKAPSPMAGGAEDRRAIVRQMAAGCRDRGLDTFAADLEAIAAGEPEPTTGACQKILDQHRRSGALDNTRHRILLEAPSFEE